MGPHRLARGHHEARGHVPRLGARDAVGVRAGVLPHRDRVRLRLDRRAVEPGRLLHQGREQGHADGHAARGLLEVDAARILVDVTGDLVPAREGVHHDRVPQGLGGHVPTLEAHVALRGLLPGREALGLGTRHVERVHPLQLPAACVREERELVGLLRREVHRVGLPRQVAEPARVRSQGLDAELLAQATQDVLRHLEARLGHADDVGPEAREGVRERVHRPAVLQIAGEDHLEPLDAAALHVQVVEVAEGLGRVLVGPVPRVDHGHGRVVGRQPGRPLGGVPQHDDVRVAASHHAHGVGQGLPLGGARAAHLSGRQDAATEAQHGRFERQARPRAGLVEEARGDHAPGRVPLPARIRGEAVGQVEERADLVEREVVDGDEVPGHSGSTPLGRSCEAAAAARVGP